MMLLALRSPSSNCDVALDLDHRRLRRSSRGARGGDSPRRRSRPPAASGVSPTRVGDSPRRTPACRRGSVLRTQRDRAFAGEERVELLARSSMRLRRRSCVVRIEVRHADICRASAISSSLEALERRLPSARRWSPGSADEDDLAGELAAIGGEMLGLVPSARRRSARGCAPLVGRRPGDRESRSVDRRAARPCATLDVGEVPAAAEVERLAVDVR